MFLEGGACNPPLPSIGACKTVLVIGACKTCVTLRASIPCSSIKGHPRKNPGQAPAQRASISACAPTKTPGIIFRAGTRSAQLDIRPRARREGGGYD